MWGAFAKKMKYGGGGLEKKYDNKYDCGVREKNKMYRGGPPQKKNEMCGGGGTSNGIALRCSALSQVSINTKEECPHLKILSLALPSFF